MIRALPSNQIAFRLPALDLLPGEIIVDSFAGGGGASIGIEAALGRSPDIAINHDPAAIAMHEANHPATRHFQESVWKVNPREVTGGAKVGLLWASPDCRHFSKAKGGKPVSPRVRGLAWVVVAWARSVKPRVICLENVPEFLTWGPLGPDNMPIKARAGETFAKWAGQLERLGYRLEKKVLNAADFGAPTSRKRIFIVARRDGLPIRWPEPTHGKGRALPWRTAAECIDWSIPCPSIFGRKKDLAEATMARIARGIKKFVLDDPKPYVVRIGQTGGNGKYCNDLDEPLTTVTTKAEHCLVTPVLAGCGGRAGQSEPRSGGDLMYTITSKGDTCLVAPTLVQTSYGERPGQAPRVPGLHKPLGTAVAGGQKHGLVAALLKHYTDVVGQRMDVPAGTITAQDHHAPLAVHLTKFRTNSTGLHPDAPLDTITGGGGGAGGHFGMVYAFLSKYYGTAIGQVLDMPLDTVTSKARFGVVTVTIEGEEYAIVDIGMRMLQPHELAKAQGFPDGYILTGTKSEQVARIGNSVCPPVAEALVRANLVAERAAVYEAIA